MLAMIIRIYEKVNKYRIILMSGVRVHILNIDNGIKSDIRN